MAQFSDLPWEIRQKVYRQVIALHVKFEGFLPTRPDYGTLGSSLPKCFALFSTIHAEALQVLHATEYFEGHIPYFGSGNVKPSTFPTDYGYISKVYKPIIYIRSKFPARVRNLALSFDAGFNYSRVHPTQEQFYIRSFMPYDWPTVHTQRPQKLRPAQLPAIRRVRIDIIINGHPWGSTTNNHAPVKLSLDDIEARLQELLDQLDSMFPERSCTQIMLKKGEYSFDLGYTDQDYPERNSAPIPIENEVQRRIAAE